MVHSESIFYLLQDGCIYIYMYDISPTVLEALQYKGTYPKSLSTLPDIETISRPMGNFINCCSFLVCLCSAAS